MFRTLAPVIALMLATSVAGARECGRDLSTPIFDLRLQLEPGIELKLKARREEFLAAGDKVEVMARALTEEGVNFTRYRSRLLHPAHIAISTDGPSRFNRLAKEMHEHFKTRLLYDPNRVAPGSNSADALFNEWDNEVFLPTYELLIALPGTSVAHEVKHAALAAKARAGRPTLTNGFMRKWPWIKAWPWGPEINSGYMNYMSLDEPATWSQFLRYAEDFPIEEQLLSMADSVYLQTSQYLTWASGEGLRNFNFHIKKIKSGPDRSKQVVIAQIANFSYVFHHQLPEKFWRPGLPSGDLKRFLNSASGQMYFRNALVDYFDAFQTRMRREQQRASEARGRP